MSDSIPSNPKLSVTAYHLKQLREDGYTWVAEEIERLTAALAGLHKGYQNFVDDAAEREGRLRAALDEIMKFTGKLTAGTTHYEGCADDHPMCRVWCIAQAAVSSNRQPVETTDPRK